MGIILHPFLLILTSLFISLNSCRKINEDKQLTQTTPHSTQSTSPVKEKSKPEIPIPPEPGTNSNAAIPPGHSRIIGKVISILPTLDKDKTTPCGKVPCQARVKVERVLGYGSAFGQPLPSGGEINVTFNFTLSPTKKYFPELTKSLPGLKKGQAFQADIRQGGDNKKKWYLVNGYEVK